MSKLSGWWTRLRRAFNRRAFEQQMSEEMREHLEREMARRVGQGEDADAARRYAAIEFGHADSFQEQVRDRRLGRSLDQACRDFRYAARVLRRAPAFSAAVMVTIGLGLGLNTAGFTLAHALLFKPVPITDGERLVTVSDANLPRTNRPAVSWPDYLEYRANNQTFEKLEAGSYGGATLTEADLPPEQYAMMRVTPGMFSLIPAPPVLGRLFSDDDGRPGAAGTVLIGYSVWQTRYEGAADVIGRAVNVNGAPATIIGVMPEGFKFPNTQDLWTPLGPSSELARRSTRDLLLFGRVKSGVTIAQADRDLEVITSRLAAEFPGETGEVSVITRTFHDTFLGGHMRRMLYLLVAGAGFVLLVAGANVANMMLSRGLARAREISVRVALGASRWQIVRQVLAESVLLGCGGGVLGFGVSALSVSAMGRATQDRGLPYWLRFEMDPVVFAFLVALSVVTGIAFGLVPALRASRTEANSTLRNGGPAGGTRRESRLTGAFVVLQFTLTMTLLGCAGLLLRSFLALQDFNPTVPYAQLLTGRLELPQGSGATYADPAVRRQFVTQLLSRLAALPGVTHVAAASHLPGLGASRTRFEIEGRPVATLEQAPQTSFIVQTPGFLAAIDLPMLQGRDFLADDGRPEQDAAVVTRTFARAHWPDESAVGKRFRFLRQEGPGLWISIVGECGDLIESPNAEGPATLVFIPQEQAPLGRMAVLLRTASDPATLAGALRGAVHGIDRSLPVYQVQTLAGAFDMPRWMVKFLGTLFLIVAVTGLVIATVGIHAVVAHATNRRTREIGIRMALGATGPRIVRLILQRGMRHLAIGIVLGLAGAAVVPIGLKQAGMLMQVSPRDPLVFTTITVVVVTVGVLACWLPARRAARANPITALRND